LAIARVIGETAPLLLTVGMVTSINWNMFDGRMATLPTFIHQQYLNGNATCMNDTVTNPVNQEVYACTVTTNIDRAWADALTLIIIVMVLNIIARLVSYTFSPKISRRADAHREQPRRSRPCARTPDGRPSAHQRRRPQHLLRPLQGRAGRRRPDPAPFGDGPDRPLRLRQVDLPAHPESDARGDPRRLRPGHGGDQRRGHLRPPGGPGQCAPPGRHGVPESQPVPHHVDPGQRPGGGEAQ